MEKRSKRRELQMAMENRKENTEVSAEVSEAAKAADVLAVADPFLERI